ncbi:hypothetical protein BIV60_13210 [Bacillus sp. MUM 116]|uniref:hypothetical protein n=1 Tax=Bacillus sp. MUM 116 TaxID=1678002 RepID=UPI0008F5E35C|nr:hypothetical protein [Bacillus sp. MUM 116]OIK14067.1 hypothetical protein BIV60_13210 [Bacillus sp. MUM 116]
MITLIVVPIIILFFYLRTKKEMREQDVKWRALANIPQEAILIGQIKNINEEKQRFYYHRYIYVQEFKLQTETRQVIVKKLTPITKAAVIEKFTVGEFLKVFGTWEGTHFIINHFERIVTK